MYEKFYGLQEKPFSIQPDPSFLYWGRTHRLAYAMLEYGVLNHAGIAVITGEVGCGKTTLIHRLLDQLSDTHTVALLSNIQEGRGDLLSWVLMGFGEPYAGKTHVELFAQLQEFFIREYGKGRRVVMIIDEAQNLSADMLEELRMLSNINAGKDQLLQLILVGQPQLKEILNRPELLQLTQRVGADFHLTPLNRQEVHSYIETRLSIAGCQRRIFTNRAMDLIAEQSRGVPRVINVISDTALVYAFSAEELVVGVETVQNVVRDKTQFGVFGLASDESAAAPIESENEARIDAFIEDQGDDEVDAAQPGAPFFGETVEPAPPIQRSEPEPAPSAPEMHTPVKAADAFEKAQAEDAREGRASAPALAVAETTQPTASRESVAARMGEASPNTGVVIVAKPGASPSAAIRAIGEGRAVVVAVAKADDQLRASASEAGAVIADMGGQDRPTPGRLFNAGYRQLKSIAPHIAYVQFVEAGQVLKSDWIERAEKFLNRRPEVSVVEGQLRTPDGDPPAAPTYALRQRYEAVGEIAYAMGSAMMVRTDAFEAAGGFRGDLETAAAEDMCVRLRKRGGRVWRLDTAMALDRTLSKKTAIRPRAARRRGYDQAYMAALHGGAPDRAGVAATVSALIWGLVLPILLVIGTGVAAFCAYRFNWTSELWRVGVGGALIACVAYGLGMLASALRRGFHRPSSWFGAIAAKFEKPFEAIGAIRFYLGRSR